MDQCSRVRNSSGYDTRKRYGALIMPPVSEAQRRWAEANKGKKGPEGRAAAEYAAADKGGKLPARVHKGKKVGIINRVKR